MLIEKSVDTSSQPTTEACRYCSEVSRQNGEDPIGTAISARQWLLIEVPQPWAKNPWQTQGKALLAVFDQIEKRPKLWTQLRILAIAPDREWSQPDKRHVFFYRQSGEPSTGYQPMHYHLPTSQLSQWVTACLFQPETLSAFDAFQLPPGRALFVCTHTQYDLACGRYGTPLYRTLRSRYTSLSVWQTSHFGGHNFAPTLIDFPTGQFWGHLTPENLDALIYRRGDVTQLLPCYRGWAALNRWEQVAERSLWERFGWAWLAAPKSVKTIRLDRGRWRDWLIRVILVRLPSIRAQLIAQKLLKRLVWAEVKIEWDTAPGIAAGRAQLRVETSHNVLTQLKSGEDQPLIKAQQYQTSELT